MMAGDWIKLEHATLDKPEIGIAAEILGISDGDAFLLFMRYWVWLDQNLDEARHGLVPFVSRKSLERKFKCSGFAAILERIGWASFDDEAQILTVINWERHNGKTAKSRALEQKRKALQRSSLSGSCPANDGTKTVLEKRREEIKDTPARKRATPLPKDFVVSEVVKAWAVTKGYDRLEQHLEYFLGYVIANGKTYIDWDQALRNCIHGNWAKLPPRVEPPKRKVAL